MDTTTLAGARMRRFLEREPVVWLSTVRPSGAPHLVPIWFWWDGDVLPAAHLAKYADQLAAIGLSAEDYAATYSQVVRIVPDRPLGWHGRQVPRSARLAGAPARSIDESTQERPTRREWLGEPLARGIRAVTESVRIPVPRPASP